VYTTVEDLARFVGLLTGSAPVLLLTASGLATLETFGPVGSEAYRAGLSYQSSGEGFRVVGQGDTEAGHVALFVADPVTGIGAIVLSNDPNSRRGLETAAFAAVDELAASRAPAGDWTPADGPLRLADIDRRPGQRSCADLAYPDAAASSVRYPVSVALEFVIDEEGNPEPASAWVVSSDDRRFDQAAADWVLSCRFSPAERNGRAVRVVVRQVVRFREP
jgi:TonB family protein